MPVSQQQNMIKTIFKNCHHRLGLLGEIQKGLGRRAMKPIFILSQILGSGDQAYDSVNRGNYGMY